MLRSANILITGCNRGLGLEMVSQLSKRSPGLVFATCRNPPAADQLNELAEQHKNIHILQLDVNNLDSYSKVADSVSGILSSAAVRPGLDFLINNAGVAPKSTRINQVTADQMTDTFLTNVVGPLFLTKAVQSLLAEGTSPDRPAVIANLSSILGSIGENTKQGGLYPYRSSKAALNAITRSMSIDLQHKNISSIAIHPGWVRTEMGGKTAPLSPEESVSGVLNLLDNFSNSMHNGNFYDYSGQNLPW